MNEKDQKVEGAFISALTRNNSQIKKDRAETIGEDAEINYKRTIEDLELEIKKLKRDRESMLDLSGDSALSLKVATDFNAAQFTEKDIAIGINLRNLEIKLEIAQARYKYLFGEK